MSIQVLGRAKPTFGEQVAGGLSSGYEQGGDFAKIFAQHSLSQKAKQAENAQKLAQLDQLKQSDWFQDLTPFQQGVVENELIGNISAQSAKSLHNASREESERDYINQILGNSSAQRQSAESGSAQDFDVQSPQGQRDISEDQILGLYATGGKAKGIGEYLHKNKQEKRKQFEEERKYHTQFSKPLEEKVQKLRESIPRKESALNLARNALESGNLSYFSPDKLADITGVDLFRTGKGAQLVTAGKENLLSNMARTSARAQNMWFEQRLNSMFPKIGQSEEANLTVQEIIEGEVAMDKLYQKTYDKLAEQDFQEHGFEKRDLDRRVHATIEDENKEIFNRTSHRIRELEEQEMGLSKMKERVGKNVTKGTPLTLAMAKLYKEKYGENALTVAKKNGYKIPTVEEFKRYRVEPQEFREGLGE